MKKKILIVEDDRDISEMIQSFLRIEYEFDVAYDGENGLLLSTQNNYDLIILDIMMPKMDGLNMLRMLREERMTPVLLLSAKDTDMDKALGLGFGADDYMHKPFSMIELQARVKAILRRAEYYNKQMVPKADIQSYRVGDLEVDFSTYEVKRGEEKIRLTAKEFEILKLFVSNPTRTYTKAQLYNIVWNDEYYGDDNVINVHIRRLREKIEKNPSRPKIIITLWGIGYKLGDPDV